MKATYPVMYSVSDFSDNIIKGSFYEAELQLSKKTDDIYPIEKIIRKRRIGDHIEYLVKFMVYPIELNTWIPQADLFDI